MKKDFSYYYESQEVPYSIWFSGASDVIETVIFLGTVQIGNLPKWVAEQCPPRTAVVQGAPHWHANKADGSDIPDFMSRYTEVAFKSLLESSRIERLHVIADSQAAPGALILFANEVYQSYMASMVLLQPLGLNASVYEGVESQRVAKFKKRIMQNGYRQLFDLLRDSRLRYSHRLLSRVIDLKNPKVAAQYSSGLKYDALADLKRLYGMNSNISIICGGKDRIFPAGEIQTSLNNADIPIEVVAVPGVPHSPLATRQGSKLLRKGLEILG